MSLQLASLRLRTLHLATIKWPMGTGFSLSLVRLGMETFSEGFEALGKTSFPFPLVSFTGAEEARQISWKGGSMGKATQGNVLSQGCWGMGEYGFYS